MRGFKVRPVTPTDFDGIRALGQRIYPQLAPWSYEDLRAHLQLFPEGQLVAVDNQGLVAGYCASLIVKWDDYSIHGNWSYFTQGGTFANHDKDKGRTLYGADVMVDPQLQGSGIGRQLYRARRELTRSLNLLRIRAGARLRNYHLFATRFTPEEYVRAVEAGRLFDPTLSFQLKQGFRVLDVVHGYLSNDPDSLGHAAVIEWINPHYTPPARPSRPVLQLVNS